MGLRNDRITDEQKLPVLFTRVHSMRIRYSLVCEAFDGVTFYGIEVDLFSEEGRVQEHVLLPELCSDRALAIRILEALHRGAVTPCGAGGVVDDMLAESVIQADLKKTTCHFKNHLT